MNDDGSKGRRRPSGLSEEDWRLWHTVGETVTPLRRKFAARRKADVPAGPDAPAARPPAPPPRGAHGAGLPPHPPPARIDERTARKLRTGRLSIDARVDLHGMTQVQAHARLRIFLEEAHRRGHRIVLVITGKGRETGGILRRSVPLWLEEGELRRLAGGWRPAHHAHGGEGALYIRLRRRDRVASS